MTQPLPAACLLATLDSAPARAIVEAHDHRPLDVLSAVLHGTPLLDDRGANLLPRVARFVTDRRPPRGGQGGGQGTRSAAKE